MTDAELDRLLAALPPRDVAPEVAARLHARAEAVFTARAAEARSPWRRAWRRGWDLAEPWAASAAVALMLGWALATVRPVWL